MKGDLAVTGDPEADRLLIEDPFALVLGMLLDQQIPMERAFSAPAELRRRLGGTLDAGHLAAMPVDDVVAVFAHVPAVHRFPRSMGERAHRLAQALVEDHDGRAADVWEGAADGADLLRRLRALPGFGEEKARIFVALLAKRFGIRPKGWEAAAGPFADDQPRSVADIGSRDAFERVRAWKKAQKAAGKSKMD